MFKLTFFFLVSALALITAAPVADPQLGFGHVFGAFTHDHHYAYEHHKSQNLAAPYPHVGFVQPYIAQPVISYPSQVFYG